MTNQVRRFDLPFTAAPGRLVNPEVGLTSIALRSGEHAPYTMDVTLLDAPDLRLVRAGVWLAHRVVAGRGEWYLGSDAWRPWLPAERVEQMGQVDLPDIFAELVRPFRRSASLDAVVSLTCAREEFALRGPATELVAVLRDDKVQVRSAGVVTASYREVTITGISDRLQLSQITWLTGMLGSVGAVRVPEFPSLKARIGAPATGLSDFPEPGDSRPGDSLEQVWTLRLGQALRQVTYADLALRAQAPGAHTELLTRFGEIRSQVQGFVPWVDRSWAADLVADVDDVLAELADAERAPLIVNSEQYLRLLDRLVSASRAPALGLHAGELAEVALAGELGERLGEFVVACDALTPEADEDVWRAALAAADTVVAGCRVQVEPSARVDRIADRVGRLACRLAVCVRGSAEYADLDLGALTSAEAFDAGRRFERLFVEQEAARARFVKRWARQRARLVALTEYAPPSRRKARSKGTPHKRAAGPAAQSGQQGPTGTNVRQGPMASHRIDLLRKRYTPRGLGTAAEREWLRRKDDR
ncbi:MAG: hypothetical protein Q4G46_12800 [Propionibacteriaceae bacterium]|nr:hypothetical protein [Propionibacteriaceae bacterium]